MNDITNPAPAASAPAPLGLIEQRAAVDTLSPEAAKAEYHALAFGGDAKMSPHRQARMEQLVARIHGADAGAPGVLEAGDAKADDTTQTQLHQDARAGKFGPEGVTRALLDAQDQQQREAFAADVMSERDLADYDATHTPRAVDEYKLNPTNDARFDGPARELAKQAFAEGISPHISNALIQGGDAIEALDDEGYAQAVGKAVSVVRGLPGGRMMLEQANAYLKAAQALPADHPKRVFAEVAAAREDGIRELARLSRVASRKGAS